MNNYLVPLNRYQFSQFYRYGYTYIPKSTLLEFDGQFSETTKQNLANHFSIISPFEYDEEILILHLSKEMEVTLDNTYFEVQEIAAIYPLSKQAKLSIQEKIDQRIKLSEPIFESVLPIIESTIQKKEIEKAIDALWQICDIEGNKDELLNVIGIDNIFKGLDYRKKGIRASKIENGNYWSILIAYDRFEFFPNETIGYFYDAGQIFAHTKNQPTFEGSGLHSFLNSLSINLKTQQIVSAIDNSEITTSYRTQTTVEQLKKYIVAPLFLMLKDELRNADDLYTTKLMKHTTDLKKFGIQFNAAVILLGSFFGYKKFYDLYYDNLNLRFYKAYNSKLKIDLKKETILPIVEISENTNVEIEVEPSNFQTKIIEETDISKNNLLVSSTSEIISESSKPVEIHKTFHQAVKENDVEIPTIVEEPKEQIQSKSVNKANPFNAIILDIITTKGEMTVTNLGKELLLQTKKKMKNEIIENIVKDISEIELFKDKSTKKVRLTTLGLFKA